MHRQDALGHWVKAVLLAAMMLCVRDARAVPAYPGLVDVKQPDGRKIQVRLRGDEYFSWHETAGGYAIALDRDGFWKYARPSEKSAAFDVVPGARVGQADPSALNLKPHALPGRAALREHLRKARKNVNDVETAPASETVSTTSTAAAAPEEQPPLPIPVAGTLAIKNIVILASFNDHWDSGAGTVLSSYGRVAVNEYNSLFNTTDYTTDGAVGSVRDYYDEVSYGKLTINSVVTVWVHLPQDESYYGTDSGSTDTNWKQMIVDAIDAADAAGFDFSQGDSDGDGWVDCLTVIHSGHAQEYYGAPATNIWSKQGQMNSVVTKDGVKMKSCHTEAAVRGISSTYITRIGVVCHEMGHFFGLPDLYDYSDSSNGVGAWGVMGNGSWNGSDGKSPAHFCAWSKYMLGFIKPVQIHSAGSLSLAKAETNAVAHMLRDGMANDEYFLIENRAKTGFDNATEITPGILIEHIDPKSYNNDLTVAGSHPVVKIEEGDGDDSLGTATNESEAGDVWTSANGLAGGFRDQTGNTSSNSMMYQTDHYLRSDNSGYYSYNLLNGFSAAGDTMTYGATTLKPAVATQTVTSPDYSISWGASSNAIQYEIQEGGAVTQTSFSDGAESATDMYLNWHQSGTVTRDSGGHNSGSYCYAMHRYYNSRWYSSVQSLTTQKPFKVTASTAISFYMMSHLDAGNGYLKCQISNDGGESWHTLGTYSGWMDPWTQQSYNYSAITAAGISLNDSCVLRFIANFENTYGWSAFPGYGFAIDDVSIANTEISAYGNWTTLSSTVPSTSYAVTGRANGLRAYQVRAFANGIWQDFGSVGTTTVNAQFTVNFQTDGTSGASLSGTTSQTVPGGGACTAVTANAPTGYHFVRWTLSGSQYSLANPLTVTNVLSNMTLVAVFAINQYTLTYATSGNGTITGSTSQLVNYGASGSQVTAVPGSGAYFFEWSDGRKTAARTETNVTSNLTFYAMFLNYSAQVFVNFLNSGFEDGTEDYPFNTMAEGIAGVSSGGTVIVSAGSSAGAIRITKAMRIQASGGTVTIGR